MSVAQLVKSFTLWEFVKAHALTLKYFFKPKVTINTKGRQLHPHYKLDLVVFEGVGVEITALERPQVSPAQGRPSDQLR